MKKIYALIAVAAAGVMTASAFNGMAFDGAKAEPTRILPASEISNLKAPQINEAKKTTLKGFSRAEGTQMTPELINSFNQGVYYLYSNNFYDENGGKVDEFRDLKNCSLTTLEASDDLQKIYMKTYLGIECPGDGVELVYNAETGQYDMDLDQVFYVSKTYGDVKFGLWDGEDIVSTGKVSFDVYSNGLVLDYDDWLFSAFPNQGQTYYFSDLTSADFMIFQPNGTLSYDYYDKEGVKSSLSKGVYFEEISGDPSNPNDLGGYLISNLMPFDDALVTYFYNVELPNGDMVIMYGEDPVSDSKYVSQTEKSGDWFMYASNEAENMYSKDVFAEFDIEANTFSWPVVPEIFAEDYAGFDQWFVESTNGYAYNTFQMADKATITLGVNGGIGATVVEEAEGPAEYYNLQGIKVANPAAGHIYIVKEGSKVSKRVF